MVLAMISTCRGQTPESPLIATIGAERGSPICVWIFVFEWILLVGGGILGHGMWQRHLSY